MLHRLGANKPAAEVTEEELVQACKDANIVSEPADRVTEQAYLPLPFYSTTLSLACLMVSTLSLATRVRNSLEDRSSVLPSLEP